MPGLKAGLHPYSVIGSRLCLSNVELIKASAAVRVCAHDDDGLNKTHEQEACYQEPADKLQLHGTVLEHGKGKRSRTHQGWADGTGLESRRVSAGPGWMGGAEGGCLAVTGSLG